MRRISLASLWMITLVAWGARAVKVSEQRCEFLENPLGIDIVNPRLSWQLSAGRQTAYQIAVNGAWDSGKVISDQSSLVEYGGAPLVSGARYEWKVRVWDENGKPSRWSKPAFWTMGLLEPQDWKGQWIGKDDLSVPQDRRLAARMLRKQFQVTGKVARATVFLSGLGSCELYLNGRKVGDAVLSPALSEYRTRVFYVTYDVTAQLKPGANACGVWLGNGRLFAPRAAVPTSTTSYGFPKLLLQLEVEYADGSRETVVSDGSWKLTTEGPILANNEYDGEEYDARNEMPGWAEAGFDDSTWRAAQLVSAPGGRLAAQVMEPIRVTGILKPIALTESQPGVFIFDMGQNLVGWCRLHVRGPTGTRVTLRHAER